MAYGFRGWLTTQLDKNDKVGAFARDYLADESIPPTDYYPEIWEYLTNHGASAAKLEGLKAAYEKWMEGDKIDRA